MSRNTILVIAAIGITFFLASLVGLFAEGSPRWVQSTQSAGWICFVVLMMGVYLLDRGPEYEGKQYTTLEQAAWACGAVSLVLFAVSLIAYAASSSPASWMEAVQVCAIMFMVALVITGVLSRKRRDRTAG